MRQTVPKEVEGTEVLASAEIEKSDGGQTV